MISQKNTGAHCTPEVAVLLPCYNEERTIGAVVRKFRAVLPRAKIYVFDNNSTDRTVENAIEAGAIVRKERQQGKGMVVRRMFRDVQADIYILADGDSTYHPESAAEMVELVRSGEYDMVVGRRIEQSAAAYRSGHRLGNWALTNCTSLIFGAGFTDMLSGYRAFSNRFVKSFPVLSGGFEIETELTIHALELGLPYAEIDTPYFDRPAGSTSKLNTWRDGYRILRTIVKMFRDEQPLRFYGSTGLLLAIVSVLLAMPLLEEFLETGLVPRLPTAVLSTGLMLAAFLALAVGFILDNVTRGRRESKLLAYLRRSPLITDIKVMQDEVPPLSAGTSKS